jgi:hypothetical protein
MIHYHGTPITPRTALATMAGRHFCVSHAHPGDLAWCVRHGASVMLDNGAFTAWTKGAAPDWPAFYAWAEPHLRHPHWAVIPDVIDGTAEDNDALIAACPLPRAFAAPVWHMHEPLDRLRRLACEWPRICIGSSGQFRAPGTAAWTRRVDDAWSAIEATGAHPWVHMLRAMREASAGAWPFRVGRQHEHRAEPRRRRRAPRASARSHGRAYRRGEPGASLRRQARGSGAPLVSSAAQPIREIAGL